MAFDPMMKMISSMLGITPEQAQNTVENMIKAIQTIDGRLAMIESKVDALFHERFSDQLAVEDIIPWEENTQTLMNGNNHE